MEFFRGMDGIDKTVFAAICAGAFTVVATSLAFALQPQKPAAIQQMEACRAMCGGSVSL